MPVTNYLWDDESDNVLMETDDMGAVTARYTNEPGQFGELISQDRYGVSSFYHYDGEHNTRQLTDKNEIITDTATYSAFGETVASTGATVNPFGYKGALGYYTNSETDDLYVRARTYEPIIARWLSVDPLGFFDGVNLFLYCNNSPLRFYDPTGHGACRVKNAFTIAPKPCELYKRRADHRGPQPDSYFPKFGFTFGLKFIFEDACCDCCSFRQYVIHRYVDISLTGIKGGKAKTIELPELSSEFTDDGELREDCRPDTGCYGHRDDPPQKGDEYSKNGCMYTMGDNPGVYVGAVQGKVIKALPVEKLIDFDSPPQISISMQYRFLINIIDTCNDNTIVDTLFIQHSCSRAFPIALF